MLRKWSKKLFSIFLRKYSQHPVLKKISSVSLKRKTSEKEMLKMEHLIPKKRLYNIGLRGGAPLLRIFTILCKKKISTRGLVTSLRVWIFICVFVFAFAFFFGNLNKFVFVFAVYFQTKYICICILPILSTQIYSYSSTNKTG